MPSIENNQSEALLTAVRRFTRASFSNSKAITDSSLTLSEWSLLWLLHQSKDSAGTQPSELAKCQGVTAGSVAQQLRSLEDQGLVIRSHNKEDRRVVLVNLTPQGLKKLQQLRNTFVSDFEQLIDFMGADDAKHFIRLLLTASEHFEKKGPN
jgi:DNA-binding MarR family transcriptional regulator